MRFSSVGRTIIRTIILYQSVAEKLPESLTLIAATGDNASAGADSDDIQRRADIHWDLKLHEFYPNIQVKGYETVNGEDAWKLEASLAGTVLDTEHGMQCD